MPEPMNESIDVIAIFLHAKKSVQPFRIRWRNQSYQVRKIFNTWPIKLGQSHELHVSVQLDTGDTAELAMQIDGTTLQWRLVMPPRRRFFTVAIRKVNRKTCMVGRVTGSSPLHPVEVEELITPKTACLFTACFLV